jgi:hypothetical protein
MRCQKSRRDCPGYRDSFEINFYGSKWTPPTANGGRFDRNSPTTLDNRNRFSSSLNTSPKSMREHSTSPRSTIVRARATSLGNLSSFSNAMMINTPTMTMETLSPTSIPWSLTTPLENQASCFFLSNYVLLPTSSTERGYLDFLVPLLKKTVPQDPIALAFSAISLAAFGNRPGSGGVSPLSGQYYLQALNKITASIQNPKQAVEDSVLGSVILLSFFEVGFPPDEIPHLLRENEVTIFMLVCQGPCC